MIEEESYNVPAIRDLLSAAFEADDLRIFCRDRPLFRPVCDRFSSADSISQMIDKLILYCEKQVLFSELLSEVQRVNPRQYARFENGLFRSDDTEHLRRSFSAWLLVDEYLSSLRLKNCSEGTISEYRKTLSTYFLDTRNTSLDVSPAELRRWAESMYRRGLARKTIANYQTTLRLFFDFAVTQGRLPSNPANTLPKVKEQTTMPKVLNPDDVRAFFAAIDAADCDRALRDRLLFRLIYTAGLTVSEAVTLRIEHFDLHSATVEIRESRLKERRIPLRPEVVALVQDWIGDRHEGWLFPGMHPNEHLSARTVEHHCREYGNAAGIGKRVSPNILRNSCATHYLAGGAPVTVVQQILGHTNLNSTGRFTNLAENERARIARQTPLAI